MGLTSPVDGGMCTYEIKIEALAGGPLRCSLGELRRRVERTVEVVRSAPCNRQAQENIEESSLSAC
jgi:hypothetical protein